MKIPYLLKKKPAGGEAAYYFNLPARMAKESGLKSQPLGKDYMEACKKVLELYEILKLDRKDVAPGSFDHVWGLYKKAVFT